MADPVRYLLNSAVLAAGAYGLYRYRESSWTELGAALTDPRSQIASRIGYPETRDLIARHTGVRVSLSRESSALAPGDDAFVVRLRYHVDPGTKGVPAQLRNDEEWEVAYLERLP